MTYIGLVAAAFDDLWALASKAIMSLACIAGDAPARSYQEKMREMKGEMKRQLSRPFQLSSECEVWSDCPVAVSFVALLDRVQELQHRLASGGGVRGATPMRRCLFKTRSTSYKPSGDSVRTVWRSFFKR